MKRRDVLRAAAALPFVWGLGCSRAPGCFAEALREIRGGRLGLVLRLPKDKEQRCMFGHFLLNFLADDEPESLDVSRQAVFICLEEEGVRTLLSGARDGETLLLIDGDGVVLDGRPLESTLGLPGAAADLLEGPKYARLRARAAATPVARLALSRREGLKAELEGAYAALGKSPAPLPYGAALEHRLPGKCSENPACYYGSGCGACGLASTPVKSRQFVKFLVK